mmetsp:Transcript_19981/g.56609  ORF Transcript_19981/g.56609 Transcript_19981/m.56609 type:complete len:215 (+) Transcript_19981:847-1491(+)
MWMAMLTRPSMAITTTTMRRVSASSASSPNRTWTSPMQNSPISSARSGSVVRMPSISDCKRSWNVAVTTIIMTITTNQMRNLLVQPRRSATASTMKPTMATTLTKTTARRSRHIRRGRHGDHACERNPESSPNRPTRRRNWPRNVRSSNSQPLRLICRLFPMPTVLLPHHHRQHHNQPSSSNSNPNCQIHKYSCNPISEHSSRSMHRQVAIRSN